jgi:hypothetical protein
VQAQAVGIKHEHKQQPSTSEHQAKQAAGIISILLCSYNYAGNIQS